MLILIGRYFLSPILFNPKLDFNKVYKYLESNNCVFVEYRGITKNEKNKFIDSTSSFNLYDIFRVVARNIIRDEFKIFWVEIKSWQRLFVKNEIRFIEETSHEEITKLKMEFKSNVVFIKDTCPACSGKLKTDDTICPNCKLHIQ